MTSLLLIGYGAMGSALYTRWEQMLRHLFDPIMIVDPRADITVPHAKQISELPDGFAPDVVVLAVKPQQLDELLPGVAKKFGVTPLYISIAAGKPLAYYEKHLGAAPIVRAMPNTPASVGQGITGLVGNAKVNDPARQQATTLMGAVGQTLWLDDEKLMDAVTAISGSGPAYFFYMMECLVTAGIRHGLTEQAATQLALATCGGSAALATHSIGTATLADQRGWVTSPGGTTAAALAILQKDKGLQKLISEAVDAAVARAGELGSL